jgi:MHS family proline/betaine transporter-like MFS transporter
VPVAVAADGEAVQLPLDHPAAIAAAEQFGVDLEATAREARASGEEPVASGTAAHP